MKKSGNKYDKGYSGNHSGNKGGTKMRGNNYKVIKNKVENEDNKKLAGQRAEKY